MPESVCSWLGNKLQKNDKQYKSFMRYSNKPVLVVSVKKDV